MKDVTFIIGFSEHIESSPHRVNNLKHLVDYLATFKLGPLLKVRQVKQIPSNLFMDAQNICHIVDTFNLGWIWNYAVKHLVSTDLFAICDTGCIPDFKDIEKAIKLLTEGFDIVNFGNKLIVQDHNGQELVIPTYTASPVFFSRGGYQKMGGWLEYPCWGIIDRAFSYIVPRLLDSYAMINGRSVHLYHEPYVMSEYERKEWEVYSADAERRRTMSYEELKRDAAERWGKCGL